MFAFLQISSIILFILLEISINLIRLSLGIVISSIEIIEKIDYLDFVSSVQSLRIREIN